MSTEKTLLKQCGCVQEEHRALRDSLARISAALSKPRCDYRQCASLVQTLRDQLVQHFRHEEEGGYFREVLAAAPWLAKQASALEQEHALLGATIDDLLSTWFSDGSRAELPDRFQSFCESLLTHEVRENNLVQQSLCDDLGSAG